MSASAPIFLGVNCFRKEIFENRAAIGWLTQSAAL